MNSYVLFVICVSLIALVGIILFGRWFKECPNCHKHAFGNVGDIYQHEGCDEHSYCQTIAEIWACRNCDYQERISLENQ